MVLIMTDVHYNTEECPLNKGYYILDKFTRYAINTQGVLIERITGNVLTWHITSPYKKKNITGGYHRRRLESDSGRKVSMSRHRLLCLTFKKLPSNPERKVINHKDGIPGNDWLDNLEWATYSKNTKHAYRSGLYPNKVRKVDVLYPSGEVKHYDLVIEAVEATGLSEQVVYGRLHRTPSCVYRDGYGFRYSEVADPWYTAVRCNRPEIRYYLKPLDGGPVLMFPNSHEAADYLRVDVRKVQTIVGNKHPVIGNYQLKRDPSKPWIEYSELQVTYLLAYPRRNFPERIIAVKGSERKEFIDYKEAATFFGGAAPSYVKGLAGRNGSFNGWKLSSAKVL